MNSIKAAFIWGNAGIAQLVEQLICNQQVVGSNPTAGSIVNQRLVDSSKCPLGHFLATYQGHLFIMRWLGAWQPGGPVARCLASRRQRVRGTDYRGKRLSD